MQILFVTLNKLHGSNFDVHYFSATERFWQQIFSAGLILKQPHRHKADEILREICFEDGMSKIRAWWIFRGVNLFGKSAAKPDLLSAP